MFSFFNDKRNRANEAHNNNVETMLSNVSNVQQIQDPQNLQKIAQPEAGNFENIIMNQLIDQLAPKTTNTFIGGNGAVEVPMASPESLAESIRRQEAPGRAKKRDNLIKEYNQLRRQEIKDNLKMAVLGGMMGMTNMPAVENLERMVVAEQLREVMGQNENAKNRKEEIIDNQTRNQELLKQAIASKFSKDATIGAQQVESQGDIITATVDAKSEADAINNAKNDVVNSIFNLSEASGRDIAKTAYKQNEPKMTVTIPKYKIEDGKEVQDGFYTAQIDIGVAKNLTADDFIGDIPIKSEKKAASLRRQAANLEKHLETKTEEDVKKLTKLAIQTRDILNAEGKSTGVKFMNGLAKATVGENALFEDLPPEARKTAATRTASMLMGYAESGRGAFEINIETPQGTKPIILNDEQAVKIARDLQNYVKNMELEEF